MKSKRGFCVLVEAAEAKAVTELVERDNKGGKNPNRWTAAAWLLERTRAEHFGKSERMQIDSTVTVNLTERRLAVIAQIAGTPVP